MATGCAPAAATRWADSRSRPSTTCPGLRGASRRPTALRFRLAERGRVVVRPSGTEPKLKCYLEVVVPVEPGVDGVDAARISAAGRLDAIRGDLRAAAGL